MVVPASTHENRATELMLEHLAGQGVTRRLALVLVDRGRSRPLRVLRAGTMASRCAWSGGTTSSWCSKVIRHAWRDEVAHGRLVRPRG